MSDRILGSRVLPCKRLILKGAMVRRSISLSSLYSRRAKFDINIWAEDQDTEYILGLAGNAGLDALVVETVRKASLRSRERSFFSRQSLSRCTLGLDGS